MTTPSLFLGIDFGTNGCRAIVIDGNQKIVARADTTLPPADKNKSGVSQHPEIWWTALSSCIGALATQCNTGHIARLAIDGTSATVLLCDSSGQPLAPALMYNDARASSESYRIAATATADSAAIGASSSLAKSLWLIDNTQTADIAHIQHQADWLSCRLTGRFGYSDIHNVLKLGFDLETGKFPDWISELGVDQKWLPQVRVPGDVYGLIQPHLADELGLNHQTEIIAGTTDSIAAFLASGARNIGDAVTSLGSTLVLKLLSESPVNSSKQGVYSHRLGKLWLVGGASNSGGAVLQKYFTNDQMAALSVQLRPETPTGFDYYPLLQPGERFPTNNPDLPPRIEPIPEDERIFFQALLEGITRIEQRGYDLLQELGAPRVKRVFTAGGGSSNKAWLKMRHQALGVPVIAAEHSDAAYGSALLAAGQTGLLPSTQ